MDKLYKFKGNYDHRSTDTNPTLYRDMIDYLDNQNNVLSEAVNAFLWQPDTDYIVGSKVITNAMPKGCIAECTAKGTSGKTEPTWTKGVINDNGVEWKVYNPTEYDIKPTANSDKPVTSGGVYTAIHSHQGGLTYDSVPTANSTNLVNSGNIKTALDKKQDKLTFDTTPTAGSTNPVTSDGVYKALGSAQGSLTLDSVPTVNSKNPVTSGGVFDALDKKQDKLTFDATPAEGSSNPVTSDGIKKALDAKTAFVDGHLVFPNGGEMWVE